MNGRVAEIQESADKLESMVRALVDDRERAWAEVAKLKKQLDDRELEFLQMDEEYRNAVKKFDEERASWEGERGDMEKQLDTVAERIRDLIPMLPEIHAPKSSDGQAQIF